jgi:cytochrome c-type biogenesis protein CcmE
MHALRQKRMVKIAILVLVMSVGVSFILYGFRENLHLYLTPSALHHEVLREGQIVRLGGMVKTGSLQREGLDIRFIATDLTQEQVVHYHGIVPDLFKEGAGMIAEGALNAEGVFMATHILAKHDENYRPPGVPLQTVQ